MGRILLALAVLSILSVQASAQVSWYGNSQGYTSRIGSSTFTQFYDGTSYNRIGNLEFRRFPNGTAGTIIYGPNSRFDSYSNPNERWTGSGTVFYGGPSLYRRYPAPKPRTSLYGW